MKNLLRGVAATVAASAVMAALAAVALALLDLPLALAPTVLTAALGGPVTLTGTVDTGFIPVALQGTVDILPLGIAAPGVVVFVVVLAGKDLLLRAAGAVGTAAVFLAVLSTADGTTVDVPLPTGPAGLTVQPGSAVLPGLLVVVGVAAACVVVSRLPYRRTILVTTLVAPSVPVVIGLIVAVVAATREPALGGVALLFGANAVLVGSPSMEGPLGGDWFAAPSGLRIVAIVLFVVVVAVVVKPSRTNTVVASVSLASALALTALLASGDISLAVFHIPLLAVRLEPGIGWALLTGALAGAAGSLTADVRWRAQQRLLRRIRAYG
ncbi:hypothetical protein [Cryptosporangium sp. NPDC048952]|uniref:hypothetical protein n=1 Tax=Cryptosporangium sp. NPDC048952 TaxID=3363961 RepID=UPI0037208E8A